MAAMILLAVCLVAASSACDICGDPNHQMSSSWQQQGGGGMAASSWQQGQQQQQQQQQNQKQQMSMMMMMMMNQMMQQKNWGNDHNGGTSGPSNGGTSGSSKDCTSGSSNGGTSGSSNSGSSGSSTTNNVGCQGFADVTFLLDSSASIGDDNFRKLKEFVSGLVGNFQLANNGRDGYQFSVVSFSNDVKEEFNLKQFKSTRALQQAIQGIPYMKQSTNTHMGLEMIRRESFLSKNGGRYGAIKIVIVITDGQSADQQGTKTQAAELRTSGALVLAIGIGDDLDVDELETITSSKANVFRVENFDVLGTIRQEVENRACQITIEQGGGSNETRTQFDWQTYLQWCTDQQRMKGEQKIAEDILKSMEDFRLEEKKEVETKVKDTQEKEKMIYMAEEVQRMEKYMKTTENVGGKLMEMKHHYMYLVTGEAIKFCPMKDMESDVMRLMMHGDSQWSPGHADQCDVEDMTKMDHLTGVGSLDQSQSAVQWAQQLANLNQTQQVEVFFSGAKDAICESLKTYVAQVKEWEDKHPELKRMLGIMF